MTSRPHADSEDISLANFLAIQIKRLEAMHIENASLDVRLLACHALKCSRIDLLSQSQRLLDADEKLAIEGLVGRRSKYEPVARILGFRQFWGLEFELNEATLEPRPDSETLIETVLKSRENFSHPRILDLGTGTGCLLLSLLHEMPDASGIGIDINPRALEQAQRNASTLGLEERALFVQGNWFETVHEKFDIIVSNPPYIPQSDIPTLMPEVRDYDPVTALDGGSDGLDPYRLIIPCLKNYLKAQGIVVLEMGVRQAPKIKELFETYNFKNILIHKDLGNIERCISANIF